MGLKESITKLPGIETAMNCATKLIKGDDKNESAINTLMMWAVDMVNTNIPIPGLDQADELANKYMNKPGKTLEQKVDSLIKAQLVKCGVFSTVTGVPGFAALPLNLVGTVYIQVCTVAAIARMGGYDANDDKVKLAIVACFAGGTAMEKIGEMVATKAAQQAAKRSVLKVIPGIGAIVAGTVDVITTKAICSAAKKMFIDTKPNSFIDADEYRIEK